MKSIEWMPFLGDRFWESEAVAAMDDSGVALYVWLLWRQFKNESLPGSDVLRTLPHRWQGKRWDRVWPQVCPCFDVGEDGRLRNELCSLKRDEMLGLVEAAREKGRKGGLARAKNQAAARTQVEPGLKPSLSTGQALNGTERNGTDRNGDERPPPAAGGSAAKPPRKAPTGPGAECAAHWEAEWARTRLGTSCDLIRGDHVAIANLLKRNEKHEVCRRMTAMLEDSDPWRAKNATPRLLESQWNSYAVTIRPASKAPTGLDAVAAVRAQRTQ